MTKHDKNDKKIVDVSKLNLSPQTILQMNATVIAGLLILLAIQLSGPSQEELVQEMRKLDIEEVLLNNKRDSNKKRPKGRSTSRC